MSSLTEEALVLFFMEVVAGSILEFYVIDRHHKTKHLHSSVAQHETHRTYGTGHFSSPPVSLPFPTCIPFSTPVLSGLLF